jgi:hypothetical protein
MKKLSVLSMATMVAFTALMASCKKNDPPKPDEQELITTVKIQVLEEFSSFEQTFEYKVENGFGGSGGTIKIDTLKLKPNTKYNAVLTVLNEKANPVEDITTEIIEESNDHLFLFSSTPNTGAGSVSATNGNKDKNGAPLNQTFTLNTNATGNGKFQVVLLHEPSNKNAIIISAAGGETDLDATFPVVLQ